MQNILNRGRTICPGTVSIYIYRRHLCQTIKVWIFIDASLFQI